MHRLIGMTLLLLLVGGCAGVDTRPECHGPWSPLNGSAQDVAHG